MPNDSGVRAEVPNLYRIVPLRVLRRTKGVLFDEVPLDIISRVDAVDRVIHEHGAFSPGSVGEVARPWYMHTHQHDHLLVLHGSRLVELYTPAHGRVETFEVSAQCIRKDGVMVCNGPAMLAWPTGVFHRVISSEQYGSASLNFATHFDGFDIRTNFSVYDLDVKTGQHRVIREGQLDQPTG